MSIVGDMSRSHRVAMADWSALSGRVVDKAKRRVPKDSSCSTVRSDPLVLYRCDLNIPDMLIQDAQFLTDLTARPVKTG